MCSRISMSQHHTIYETHTRWHTRISGMYIYIYNYDSIKLAGPGRQDIIYICANTHTCGRSRIWIIISYGSRKPVMVMVSEWSNVVRPNKSKRIMRYIYIHIYIYLYMCDIHMYTKYIWRWMGFLYNEDMCCLIATKLHVERKVMALRPVGVEVNCSLSLLLFISV